MTHAWLSLGSNVQREAHINGALADLRAIFGPLTVSHIYESIAVGFDGDAFFNLVVGIDTDLEIAALIARLREIESKHGRVRGESKFSPRTLDIDLLTYGDLVTDTPVALPRDEITKYAFVLLPLSEVAGDEIHPVLQQDYLTLWQHSGLQDQELWPIEFDTSAFTR